MRMTISTRNPVTPLPPEGPVPDTASSADKVGTIDQIAADIGREFEQRRIEALDKSAKYRLWAFLGTAAAGGLLLVLWLIFRFDFDLVVFGTIGAASLGFYQARKPARQYRNSVKDEAFPRFVKTFGPSFQYRRTGHLPMDFLKRSQLIPGHDERHFEDLISGTWESVPFQLCEAKLVDVRGAGKNRRRVTVFKGVFATFHLPSRVRSRTIIRRDMGAIGNWFGKAFSNLDRVSLEDPVFEKEFEVYGDDQVASRTLLTTTFMERLRALAQDIGNGKLQAAFYEEQLLVMIPCNKNRFEPTLSMEPNTARRDLEQFAADMKDILRVAERLKLGDNLGL